MDAKDLEITDNYVRVTRIYPWFLPTHTMSCLMIMAISDFSRKGIVYGLACLAPTYLMLYYQEK